MVRSVAFEEVLSHYLKNSEGALGYLNEVLSDYQDTEDSQKELLLCLRSIAQAQGGMSQLAKKMGLERESLYKTLSEGGNPRLGTLTKIISALFDFDIEIKVTRKNGPESEFVVCR